MALRAIEYRAEMSEIIGGDADMMGGMSRCLEMLCWASLDDVDRPAISDRQ
jgi:hypothetical protein